MDESINIETFRSSRDEIQIFESEDISKRKCNQVYIWKRGILNAYRVERERQSVSCGTLKKRKYSILVSCKAYLTVQASAVVAHLASDAPLFRHRPVQLFARLVKDLGSFCSIILARRVIPGIVSTLVPLHLGRMLQPCLKLYTSKYKWRISINLSLSLLNQTILLSQTKFFQFTRQISISSYWKYYLKQIIKRFYSFQEFSLHIFSNLEQNETFVLLKLVTKKKKRMVFFLPFFKGITIELCLVRSISSPVR